MYMLQAELEIYSLNTEIKVRMLNYLMSVVNGKHTKLAYQVYKLILNDTNNNGCWGHNSVNISQDHPHS